MLHKLKSGMNVVLQENHSAPVVALQVWVNAGSADDPGDKSGMAHVLEHMVFKGTHRRAEGQIAREIENSGGQINAWTSYDQTVFHVVIASRFFQRGLDILADAMQNSRIDEDDLRRELQVINEEIRLGNDSPGKAVAREMFATAYRKHPYRRPVIGRARSVSRLTKEHVESFAGKWYTPANMTLVVVGDISEGKALRQIRRLFGGAATPRPEKIRVKEPGQRRMRVSVLHRPTQEAHITMAFHIPDLVHPHTPVLDLATVILGEGESSRLVRRLKNDRQLVTHIYAYAYTPRDPGLFIVGATVLPKNVERAVEAMAAEVFAMGAEEVTTDELRRAMTIVESEAVFQKETVQGQARKLGFYQTVAGDVAFEQEYNRRVSGATPAELRQVTSRYLKRENLSVVVMSPRAKGKEADIKAKATAAVTRATEKVARARTMTMGATGKVMKVTLGNGARLLVKKDTTVPLVSMRAVWNGGLRSETTRTNGIHNMLASLITRGTGTRSAASVSEAIEKMAGTIGGFSGNNSFGIYSEILAGDWEQGLEIVADCLLSPAFAADEVERTRQRAIEDILSQQDNPATVALQLFGRAMYRKHPYRMTMLGTVKSVSGITREQLVRYYQRHFTPGNMVLAVVGDVDTDRVKAKFRQLFGRPSRGKAVVPKISREPGRTAPVEVSQTIKQQQAHVVLGYPGTTVRSRERYVLDVMTSVLSGQGGRLFQQLRERQSLAYKVGAFSMEGIEPGYFAVYVATSPEKVQAVLAAIEKQIQRLKDSPVPLAELNRVKRYLVGTHEISLQRKSSVAAYLAFSERYGLGYQSYLKYPGAVMSVTPQDVMRVARKYLKTNRKVVVVVKPRELSPGAAARLGEGRKVGTVNPEAKAPKKRRARKKKKARKRKR